jgi:hypothetical protein
MSQVDDISRPRWRASLKRRRGERLPISSLLLGLESLQPEVSEDVKGLCRRGNCFDGDGARPEMEKRMAAKEKTK